MKTQVKKIDEHKRELLVEIEGNIIQEKFNSAYEKIGRSARVPGFRQGLAPAHILERHYFKEVKDEVLKQLIPEFYQQALSHEGLEAVSQPRISDVNLTKSRLSFKVDFEVRPKIELRNYKGLKVEYKKIEILEEEVKNYLDKLKAQSALQDENWVRSFGYPNQEELEKAIRAQVYLEKNNARRVGLENSIIEQLLKQINFKVPPVLLNQSLDILVERAKLELVSMHGKTKEFIDGQESILRQNLEPQAEKEAKIYLIMEEIARRQNIEQNEQRREMVTRFLLKEAQWRTD